MPSLSVEALDPLSTPEAFFQDPLKLRSFTLPENVALYGVVTLPPAGQKAVGRGSQLWPALVDLCQEPVWARPHAYSKCSIHVSFCYCVGGVGVVMRVYHRRSCGLRGVREEGGPKQHKWVMSRSRAGTYPRKKCDTPHFLSLPGARSLPGKSLLKV